MRLVAPLVLFILIWSPASATTRLDTAGHLLRGCRVFVQNRAEDLSGLNALENFAHGVRCPTYIWGFIHGYRLGGGLGICQPANITEGQAVAVYVQWGDRNPAKWHLHPAITLELAFKEAFPCR